MRSRTYWNVFLLDKILAEETGRPVLLPYRRSSIPLPSINEPDELESWPPLPLSSALAPVSVRHIIPRRGYVMSCVNWAVRLAIISEDIINLESQTPATSTREEGGTEWDTTYEQWKSSRGEDVEGLAAQLDNWRKSFPTYLEVDMDPTSSPLPHVVILLAVSLSVCSLADV